MTSQFDWKRKLCHGLPEAYSCHKPKPTHHMKSKTWEKKNILCSIPYILQATKSTEMRTAKHRKTVCNRCWSRAAKDALSFSHEIILKLQDMQIGMWDWEVGCHLTYGGSPWPAGTHYSQYAWQIYLHDNLNPDSWTPAKYGQQANPEIVFSMSWHEENCNVTGSWVKDTSSQAEVTIILQ